MTYEYGADEDVAIAALLHDAVEDCGGLTTLELIRAEFGDAVAGYVREKGFSEGVADIVCALLCKPGASMKEYVNSIILSDCPMASRIIIRDMEQHPRNWDASCLENIPLLRRLHKSAGWELEC